MLPNLGENHVRLAFRWPFANPLRVAIFCWDKGRTLPSSLLQNTAAFIVGGKAISICMS